VETKNNPKETGRELIRLMELVARLRAKNGCPWDRKQTPKSAASYILEESYEAVDAIESGDKDEIMGELGDVLFQVVFQAQLFAEKNAFSLFDTIKTVREKMIRRHPHVFGENHVQNSDQVRELWGKIKDRERSQNGQGLLDSVPKGAPALKRASRLGQRAAKVGFDWDEPDEVWEKVQEEITELKNAKNREETQAELGDLLFSLAQWARHKELDPEAALRGANQRFQKRFTAMESLAKKRGLDLGAMKITEMDRLWEEIKLTSPKGDNQE
jgi:tetrapyrrole methylase family protein/MazG family protein/ATP diphosphatase